MTINTIDNQLKKNVAVAALDYIPSNSIIGIGSGSTILHFIQALYNCKKDIIGAVSSSHETTILLQKYGIKVFDINTISESIIYIDSADEVNTRMQMIKGGGGALTKEKIIAEISKKFICIIDNSKLVKKFDNFPVPIEIIPMSYSYISQKIKKLGGIPKYRKGFITDQGNIIIDVYNLNLSSPVDLERLINSFPGVVTVGIFAIRPADLVLISKDNEINVIESINTS